MNRQVSPKQVALALGVSEASVKRWCDQGLMSPARTAGGHRRIAIHDVVRFARSRGNPLMRPDVLGLPAVSGGGELATSRAVDEAYEILKDGDEMRLLRLAINLYLGRRTVLDIVERVFIDAWSRIGDGWQDGRVEIFEERRGVEITLAALRDLGHILTPPEDGAPVAVGATFPGDPYALPLAMGTVVLRESGIDAESFGAGLPADAIAAAVMKRRPSLLWLSISIAAPTLKADLAIVLKAAKSVGAAVALGGRAMNAKDAPPGATVCATLSELVEFARGLRKAPEAPTPPAVAVERPKRREEAPKPRNRDRGTPPTA